jgi:hypothetical protein
MFELQTQTAPAGLATLGQVVEVRELPYGQMRETMAQSDKPGQSAERLLGASLHIDGQPIGYGGLQALPGRFSGAISNALEQVLRLHGLMVDKEPESDMPAPAVNDDTPGPKA